MDIQTLGAAIAIAKSIPGTAAQRAETAQEAAETAAELAQQYGYSLSIEDDVLVVGEEEQES